MLGGLLRAALRIGYNFAFLFLLCPRAMSDARDESGHLIRELHGVTLADILDHLVAHYTFAGLDERLRLNCFSVKPSVKSSLTFLRRTPWARA